MQFRRFFLPFHRKENEDGFLAQISVRPLRLTCHPSLSATTLLLVSSVAVPPFPPPPFSRFASLPLLHPSFSLFRPSNASIHTLIYVCTSAHHAHTRRYLSAQLPRRIL